LEMAAAQPQGDDAVWMIPTRMNESNFPE
jgi:hypothetical protein